QQWKRKKPPLFLITASSAPVWRDCNWPWPFWKMIFLTTNKSCSSTNRFNKKTTRPGVFGKKAKGNGKRSYRQIGKKPISSPPEKHLLFPLPHTDTKECTRRIFMNLHYGNSGQPPIFTLSGTRF